MSGCGSLSQAEAETLIYCTSNTFQTTADRATLAYVSILCHVSLRSWGRVSSSNWGRGHM